jgi:hypothetical protein
METKTKVKSTQSRKRRAHEFVVDGKGKRVAIVLPIEEYEELIEAVEQHYDALAVAEADAEGGEAKPWEQVKAELRAEGKLP